MPPITYKRRNRCKCCHRFRFLYVMGGDTAKRHAQLTESRFQIHPDALIKKYFLKKNDHNFFWIFESILIIIIRRKHRWELIEIKFTKAYEDSKDSVYGYLLYMTKNVQLAEDLSQETFLKMFLSIAKFKGDCEVKTWALTIARNTFLSYARKKKAVLLEEHVLEMAPSPYRNEPESSVLQQEERELIQNIMLALNESERTVLLLCDYEGLTYEETARITNISSDAVKGRIYRARQKFRRLYQEALGQLLQ